jgi:hypothetical protein
VTCRPLTNKLATDWDALRKQGFLFGEISTQQHVLPAVYAVWEILAGYSLFELSALLAAYPEKAIRLLRFSDPSQPGERFPLFIKHDNADD